MITGWQKYASRRFHCEETGRRTWMQQPAVAWDPIRRVALKITISISYAVKFSIFRHAIHHCTGECCAVFLVTAVSGHGSCKIKQCCSLFHYGDKAAEVAGQEIKLQTGDFHGAQDKQAASEGVSGLIITHWCWSVSVGRAASQRVRLSSVRSCGFGSHFPKMVIVEGMADQPIQAKEHTALFLPTQLFSFST